METIGRVSAAVNNFDRPHLLGTLQTLGFDSNWNNGTPPGTIWRAPTGEDDAAWKGE